MKINYRYFIGGGLAVAVALALFISPFASSSPDGLEKVAVERGFIEKGRQPVWMHAIMPNYRVPWTGRKSEALAGAAGVLLTFGVAVGIAFAVAKRKKGNNGR